MTREAGDASAATVTEARFDFAFGRTRKLAGSEKEQVIQFLRRATNGIGGKK